MFLFFIPRCFAYDQVNRFKILLIKVFSYFFLQENRDARGQFYNITFWIYWNLQCMIVRFSCQFTLNALAEYVYRDKNTQ